MTFYNNIKPIDINIPADRQLAKRHYGVHPYFTRRPPNVVRKYVLNYSKEGDVVLDPFGGSGVTAIEAFLENRVDIQNDINPLANFIAKGIVDLSKGNIREYSEALLSLKSSCENRINYVFTSDEDNIRKRYKTIKLPENIDLPSNSDVDKYHDLFTYSQLISLAIIKQAIDDITDKNARAAMLLAWSASLTKINKTFLSAAGRAESRGGSSIFSIYRYKVAKKPVELHPWRTFFERAQNILAAKREIDKAIELKKMTHGWHGGFRIYYCDIEELHKKMEHKADYIFTDPPYGGNISYLDLSLLWNSWLGIVPSMTTREKELIVGGELHISEEVYIKRLGDSIRACLKMLKKNRWLSVVFQHWNIEYFKSILNACAEEGAELKAAVSQIGDPIWSMHKKKNRESVLAGEMILTFYKSGISISRKQKNSFDVKKCIMDLLKLCKSGYIYGEMLFNNLIIEAWNRNSIESVNITRHEFIKIMEEYGWKYDEGNHYWTKINTGHLPLFE